MQIVSLTKDRERLMEEQAADKEQLASLKQENARVTGRLDSLLEVTQKDRVQATVDKLDLSSYVEQIARLKKSEELSHVLYGAVSGRVHLARCS